MRHLFMKIQVITTLIGFFLLNSLVLAEGAGAGLDLAKKVYYREDGNDSVAFGKMVLIEKGHKPRERVTTTYTQEKQLGEVKTLIRFSAPANVKHTSLLGMDTPDGNNNQWLFLPALGKVRKISSERKGGRFVGSDVYYEDMQDRHPDRDSHKLLGTKTIKGATCQMLESVPKPDDNSHYSKKLSCIHLKTLLPLNVDFYIDDQLVKSWQTVKMKKIQGYWTIIESLITDAKSSHQTRLITKNITYDQNLSDALFSRQVLEDPGAEKNFFRAAE